jgi:hypothetical protein
MKIMSLISLVLTMSIQVFAEPNCVETLQEAVREKSYGEQQIIIDGLKAKQMACLFEHASSDLIPLDFWVDEAHMTHKRVQKFHGKNSLPVMSQFEKHFLAVTLFDGTHLVGYNTSTVGRWIHSPGFFYVNTSGVTPALSSQTVFDYTIDFNTVIPPDQLLSWQGIEVTTVKNNRENILFGGLRDEIRMITENIVIGRAHKLSKDKYKHQAYFVLLRQP